MLIRRERQLDYQESRAIPAVAFDQGAGEPIETQLLDALRASAGWIPALSWVAEIDGAIVGHNICTRGYVGDHPALGLGPIGVLPGLQRSGVGSALMHAMIGAADAAGESVIALLGDPGYYSRFNFVPSTLLGIAPPNPEWGPFFQALPLSAWSDSITGEFRYASPFDNLD